MALSRQFFKPDILGCLGSLVLSGQEIALNNLPNSTPGCPLLTDSTIVLICTPRNCSKTARHCKELWVGSVCTCNEDIEYPQIDEQGKLVSCGGLRHSKPKESFATGTLIGALLAVLFLLGKVNFCYPIFLFALPRSTQLLF